MLLQLTDQLGRVTKHEYDANRNEIKRTNALGEATTYTYDANGNQTSSTNALGETTTTTYNAFSEPLTALNPIGNTTTIAYDDSGLPTSFTDRMGSLATFTSSEHGLPLTVSDAAGNAVVLGYDASGDLTVRTDRLGRQTTNQFDGMGRKTKMTDPRGGVTTYTYDQDGDLLLAADPLGFGQLKHYDDNRNVQQTQDRDLQIFRADDFRYDADNHLTTILHDTDGSSIQQTSDFRGNVLTKADEIGNTTTFTYDLAGQLIQTTNPDGTFTTQSFDALGRLQSKTDERGNTTTYAYEPGCDCSDRMISVTDPLNRTTSMTYDAMSQKTSMTDANGHQTFYAYDLRGRLIETDYADGTATHDTYDGLGRRIASADQTGATTHYGYDAEGQLTSVTDPLGNVTSYGYDPNGNLTSVTDANNHTTTYAYDAGNRKISRTLPLGMTETFDYDGENNLISHTDFRGKAATYAYDGRRPGRLTSKVPDPSLGEPTLTYAYNTTGTRSTMNDASGTTTYTYDTRNRLLTKATPEGTLTYTYDASGNVASIDSSNANGTSVGYLWDAANQLSTVTDNRLGGMTTAAYTATGRPASLAQPNGVGVTYGYDSLDRVTSMAWKKGANPAFASFAYGYNPRGQRLSSTDVTGRDAAYGYDTASRLTSETITGDPSGPSGNGALTYVIDPVGNRSSRASTLAALGAQSFSYDVNDELTTDAYDLNGNTTSSGGHTYAYDFENRLVSKDSGAVTLVYDGDGNRVAKTAAGVTTQYLVDELNPTGYLQVMDEVSGGAAQVRYTYGNMLVSQTRSADTSPATSFYGYDGDGNVAFLADAAGNLTDTYTYDAWGNLIGRTGSTSNTRLFSGQELDPDLGLINLRARYYQPVTGRLITVDPLDIQNTSSTPSDPQADTLSPAHFGLVLDVTGPSQRQPELRAFFPSSLNRYLYTSADPINFSDLRGLDEFYEEYAVSAPEGAIPEEATSVTVTFGQDGGAHAFRHVLQVGLSRLEVENAVLTATQEILTASPLLEKFTGVTNVGGFDIFFSAYFRTAVLLNIGRITIGP
jgi:RHS repeat-associated protein